MSVGSKKRGFVMSIRTFELANKNGMTATVSNLGCAIISLRVPGKDKKVRDVVCGLDSAEDYTAKKHPFFGVICGRVANRIANARFTLNGKEYTLEANDGVHHLHGGTDGFDKKVWTVEEVSASKVAFSYVSQDGESGYPGKLTVYCIYTLTDDNIFRIDYRAEADAATICNLTNHSYFNLEGHDASNIYGHVMKIHADKFTPVDETLIPTGELKDVAGTPFDFRTPKPIGQDIKEAGGYDHNFVLNHIGEAANVYAPVSGIRMIVKTNSPGMQLYTGNFLNGSTTGKGVASQQHSAFCVETQFFPDSINQPNFPSVVVTTDAPQEYYTEFGFSWDK